MIVYIPETFIKHFEKDFRHYHFSVEEFAIKLKVISAIHIKEPVYKIKLFLNGVALRGFVVKKTENILVPVCLFTKESKYGENLTLDKYMSNLIDTLMDVYKSDFENGRYRRY